MFKYYEKIFKFAPAHLGRQKIYSIIFKTVPTTKIIKPTLEITHKVYYSLRSLDL